MDEVPVGPSEKLFCRSHSQHLQAGLIGKRNGFVNGDQYCVWGKMDKAAITFFADTECFDRLFPRRDVSNHEKVAGDLGRSRAKSKPFSMNPTGGSIRAMEPELA